MNYLNQVEVENEGAEIYLIRGLRNGDDLQMEQNQIQFIKEMSPGVKPVFFLADRRFEHISSTALRALKKFSEKEYYKYVYRPPAPPEVKKFGEWTNGSTRICSDLESWSRPTADAYKQFFGGK